MKYYWIILAFANVLAAQVAAPHAPPKSSAAAANPDEVVIAVGARRITAGQYDTIVRKMLAPDQQEVALGDGRRQFAARLVELSVLADEAEKQHLDQQPQVATQLEVQRNNMLASAVFQNLQQTIPVPETDIQAYYDAHKADYETITVRHILVRVKDSPTPAVAGKPELTDAEARAKAESIRKRILAGEDFAKIAKAESDDIGESGGDLGELRHGMTAAPFEEAAFALKPGDISEPVLSPFGYHIIQVRSHAAKSVADVRDDILTQLKPELARKAIEKLVSNSKFNIDDAFFGPPQPAVATPAGK